MKLRQVAKTGSLHLPKRPEIPERPKNTGKTCEWFNTCSGEGGGGGGGRGHLILIFKKKSMSIFKVQPE